MDISSAPIENVPENISPRHISHDLSENIWERWTTSRNPFINIISNNIINTIPEISSRSNYIQSNIGRSHSHDISSASFFNHISYPARRVPLSMESPSEILSYAFRSIIDPLEDSFHDEAKYKHIIVEEEENNLKIIPYHAENYNDIEICPITREKFEEGEDVIQLPCSHLFNKEGILHWLKKFDATCPVCRHKFTSKEVKKDIHCPRQRRISDVSFRTHLFGLMDEQLRREDDALLQQALLASLRDTT